MARGCRNSTRDARTVSDSTGARLGDFMKNFTTRGVTGVLAAVLTTGVVLTTGLASADAPSARKPAKKVAAPARYEPPRIVEPAPPEVSWPSIWQGFYAGASVGYGWGASTHTYDRNDNHGTAEQSLSGLAGSVTVGYNFLMSPTVVGGLEADLGVMDLTADDKVIFDGHVWKSQFGPMWGTIRGRLGFLMGGQTLVYGTGGVAFMSVDEIGYGDAAGQTAWNQTTRSGWVLGAGIEHALSSRMTAKVEYLHMDFGTYTGLSENQETYTFDNSVNLIRAGLNVKF